MEGTPDSGVVDAAGLDEERIALINLQGNWEKNMKDFSPKKKHRHVEAFMFYWNEEDPSYLKTEEEVSDNFLPQAYMTLMACRSRTSKKFFSKAIRSMFIIVN